ncbi:hypothetical protein IMCC9480_1307 [Oxalobacteraceae bacterium IMCC9480]|nr:hypothetical protein IMCC9480_1307 [Oxalobacteraceae bacterium IMCC9480]
MLRFYEVWPTYFELIRGEAILEPRHDHSIHAAIICFGKISNLSSHTI